MARPGAPKPGLEVNLCSVCEEFAVCLSTRHPRDPIRYCRACFQETLAWRQLANEEVRAKVLGAFDRAAALPQTQRLLAWLATVSPEQRNAIAQGESIRRLFATRDT